MISPGSRYNTERTRQDRAAVFQRIQFQISDYATERARQDRATAITAFLFRAAAFVMFGLIAMTLCLIASSLIALAVDMPDVLARAEAERGW